jgi:hypothetical protein
VSQEYHDAITRRLGLIQNLGTTALNNSQTMAAQRQAMEAANRAAAEQSAMYGAIRQGYSSGGGGQTSSGGGGGGGAVSYSSGKKYRGTGKDTFENFMGAIAQRESGGNYRARNRDSGAMGKYQIMPGNIQGSGGWDMEVLGRNISTQQFMNSPQLQEQIAQGMLRKYYNKWGPGGAAVAWYAGPGRVAGWQKNRNSGLYQRAQGKYSSINAYAQGILRAMGLL